MIKNKKTLIVILLLIVLFFSIVQIVNLVSRNREINRISELLDCEPNLVSIHQSIVNQFERGKTRDEINKEILLIDPKMDKQLGKDNYVCFKVTDTLHCDEYLHFYSETFDNRFGVGFHYDNKILVNISGLSF